MHITIKAISVKTYKNKRYFPTLNPRFTLTIAGIHVVRERGEFANYKTKPF